MMITPEVLQAQAKMHGILRWPLRQCSICGYQLAYHFLDNEVYFDAGCYCVKRSLPNLLDRSWQHLADHFNLQTHPDVVKEYRAFWKLD